MLRRLILASALVAGSAIAQENTDISGANFQSGKADATLAALGRKAAASGSKLVITAPADWHSKIAAKVKAGGNADVVLREGFYENVLVRVESKAAAAAPKPVVEAERTSKADVEKSKADAEKAKADAERMKAEAEKAKAEAEMEKSRAEAEKAKAEAEATRARTEAQAAAARAAAAPAPVAAAPQAPAAPSVDPSAIRTRLEKSLNDGRTADGNLAVGSLQSGDTLYVDGPVRAVTRREGRRLALYWLDGDLDLRRSELKVLAPDRYQVMAAIHGEGALRKEFASGATALAAREPAADAPARVALEKSLNDGHTITETVVPTKLKSGDVIYINGTSAAVVRRIGRDIARYWLVGALDLQQAGLQADGPNKYKVLNDTLR
jgi:chemotaxis protein histidine kinase CheA